MADQVPEGNYEVKELLRKCAVKSVKSVKSEDFTASISLHMAYIAFGGFGGFPESFECPRYMIDGFGKVVYSDRAGRVGLWKGHDSS